MTALGLVPTLLGCPPPATRCRDDADCDTAVRFCGTDGTCTPLSERPTTGLPERCTLYGAALDSVATAGPTIRVGALLPKTRADNTEDPRGRLREQALRLVVDELNPPQRSGIGGRTLTLISCDSSGNSTRAAELAASLRDLGVVAIISAGSSETLAASAVTLPAGILLLSGSATSPEITDLPDRPGGSGPGLVWRTAASDAFQGAVLAQAISQGTCGTLPVNARAAVVYVDDAYGQGLYSVFRTQYGNANQQGFLYTRSMDIMTAVMGAEAYQPDVLVVIGFPDDAARIMDATVGLPRLGTVPVMLTDSAKAPSLFAGTTPSRLDGACGTAPAAPDPLGEAYAWFGQQYEQKFSESPLSASFVANNFDAMMLVAVAAAYASQPGRTINGATLAEGLTHLSAVDGGTKVLLDPPRFNTVVSNLTNGTDINVQGVSGPLDFDNGPGEAVAGVDIWRASDGGFTTVTTVQP